MPCAALARGIRTTVSIPPFSGTIAQPNVFNDAIQNNPCARKAVTSVNGVNVSAENLCPTHWISAHGYRDWVAPIVLEP